MDQKLNPENMATQDEEVRNLAARLRAEMVRQELTPEQLAPKVGLSVSSVKAAIGGNNLSQTVKLAKFARALHTTPNALLGFETKADDGPIDFAVLRWTLSRLLTEMGMPDKDAELAVEIALEAASEPPIQGIDRHHQAVVSAITRLRRSEHR